MLARVEKVIVKPMFKEISIDKYLEETVLNFHDETIDKVFFRGRNGAYVNIPEGCRQIESITSGKTRFTFNQKEICADGKEDTVYITPIENVKVFGKIKKINEDYIGPISEIYAIIEEKDKILGKTNVKEDSTFSLSLPLEIGKEYNWYFLDDEGNEEDMKYKRKFKTFEQTYDVGAADVYFSRSFRENQSSPIEIFGQVYFSKKWKMLNALLDEGEIILRSKKSKQEKVPE